jgi:glutamate 5-kinase
MRAGRRFSAAAHFVHQSLSSTQMPASKLSPDQLIKKARRITIKVGSSLLIDESLAVIRRNWLAGVAKDIAHLRQADKEIVIVSSGAVALGRQRLALKRSNQLALKQAAAASGQPLLMKAWDEAFLEFEIPTAQLLLTLGDTESRRRWLNARATMEVLLRNGALPIVNENDTVATDELRYGDNDRLSARIAQMSQSDVLVLLSDVDGLYTADPARHSDARHMSDIPIITEEVERWAGAPCPTGLGTGGMRTKLAAARIAQSFGCATIIASGRSDHPITALVDGEARATVFHARGSPSSAYKQWIAAALLPAGSITIDEGAVCALLTGKSLLPAGARSVDGSFERGVCLRIIGPAGDEIGRGITAYSSAEATSILGCSTREIEARLGYRGPDELIHRNDLVLV